MVDITKEENQTKDKSIVNRLREIFVNRRLTFTIENFGKFDYRNLMNNKDILIDTNVTDKFDELNTAYHFQINQKNKRNVNYIMKLVNDEMMKLGRKLNYSRSDIVDMLIVYLFKLKDSEHKNVLWSCFGDVIVENLKNNIQKIVFSVKNVDTGLYLIIITRNYVIDVLNISQLEIKLSSVLIVTKRLW